MYHMLYLQVIQLQGDQRKNVATFLVQVNYMGTNVQIGTDYRVIFIAPLLFLMTCFGQAGIAKKESIKIHGFQAATCKHRVGMISSI